MELDRRKPTVIPNLQVEDAEALCEFDGIAAAADGIILSRGNLGLDVASHLLQYCHEKRCCCNLLTMPTSGQPQEPQEAQNKNRFPKML